MLLLLYERSRGRKDIKPYTRCANEVIFLPVRNQTNGVRRPYKRQNTVNDVLAQIRYREEAAISAIVQESTYRHNVAKRVSKLNHRDEQQPWTITSANT